MNKGTTKTLLVFMCVFVAWVGAPAAHAQDWTAISEELEKTIVQEMKRTSTPGVAIAVVKDDRVVFAKAFGFSNLEAQIPMTTDTLCRSGPITSIFTAAALVMPQEQGKLRLDQPLGRPVGLLVLKDGSLLISDDGANKIWQLTYWPPGNTSTSKAR